MRTSESEHCGGLVDGKRIYRPKGVALSFLPEVASLAAATSDRRFPAAIVIAILAGTVRGFSGFGSALIYIPLISLAYGPATAAASFVIVDFVTGLSFGVRIYRLCQWREVLPLAAASAAMIPFGAIVLKTVDPIVLRVVISLLVLSGAGALAFGWRYHVSPSIETTVGVGLFAGLIGGAVQIAGPPVIIFWLGSRHSAAVARANLVAYFMLFVMISVAVYAGMHLLTPEVVALAAVLAPIHVAASMVGARLFPRASDRAYRRLGYAIVVASGFISLPIFDSFTR
jgi:hypothetical protein